jgi:hypothetical protein
MKKPAMLISAMAGLCSQSIYLALLTWLFLQQVQRQRRQQVQPHPF